MRKWIVAGALWAMTGCGKGEPAPTKVPSEEAKPLEAQPRDEKPVEPDKPEATPKTEAKAEQPEPKKGDEAKKGAAPKKGDAPKRKPKKEDKAAGKKARQEFQRLLDEGRKAVKSDDIATGMAKLEAALKHIPGHPSALGELGWAAYRAGPAYFDTSLDATRRALSVSKTPKQRGALWYNLGRVFEDRGDLADALDAYQSSLAHRPGNTTVQERRDALVSKLGGKTPHDGLEKLDDACAELRDEQGCQTAMSAEGLIAHSCECQTELLGPETGFGKAALMQVTGMAETGGAVDSTYLAVEVAGRWHVVTMVGNDWNPGAFGISNTSTRSEVTFATVAGQVLLWVLYDNEMNDIDMGDERISSDWSRSLTLCGLHDGKLACLGVPLGSGTSVEALTFENEDAPENPVAATRSRLAWRAAAHHDGIEFTLEEKTGEVASDFVPSGKLTFTQLFTTPGVVVYPL